MPATVCPKCGSQNAYCNVLFNFSAVTCRDCGYREEPRQMFTYSQEDMQADQETLDMVYGREENDYDPSY